MPSAKFISSLILSLASLQAVSTSPVNEVRETTYPDVIPGPGLPSLQSLGLTSAQLYEMPKPEACMPLPPRLLQTLHTG